MRRDFQAAQARALVIDRADLLDTCALEMLLRWYEYRKRQFALILCFTLPTNATGAETLKTLYRAIPQALLDDPIELPRLGRKEFTEYILPAILDELKLQWPANLTEELQIAKRAWETTEGDWRSIDYLKVKLRRAMVAKGGRALALTPVVLKEVFGTWAEPT